MFINSNQSLLRQSRKKFPRYRRIHVIVKEDAVEPKNSIVFEKIVRNKKSTYMLLISATEAKIVPDDDKFNPYIVYPDKKFWIELWNTFDVLETH